MPLITGVLKNTKSIRINSNVNSLHVIAGNFGQSIAIDPDKCYNNVFVCLVESRLFEKEDLVLEDAG